MRCLHLLLLTGAFALLACSQNDLSKVKAVKMQQQVPMETTKGAKITYSDSAHVKAILEAPVLYHFKTDSPYYEMPKGIKVTFYDEQLKPSSTVTADYAIRKENQKLVELRHHVVAKNAQGKTFTSDELIWDENSKRFYSNKLVTITTDQAVISGTSFWATEDFNYYEIKQGAGPLEFKDDLSE